MDFNEDDYFVDVEHVAGTCACCGGLCSSVTTEEGAGLYEFWGQAGIQRECAEVSPCCRAKVL